MHKKLQKVLSKIKFYIPGTLSFKRRYKTEIAKKLKTRLRFFKSLTSIDDKTKAQLFTNFKKHSKRVIEYDVRRDFITEYLYYIVTPTSLLIIFANYLYYYDIYNVYTISLSNYFIINILIYLILWFI